MHVQWLPYFLEFFPWYYWFQSVLACRYNSRVGTIQGQMQLLSQYFHTRMRTALLADSARTNMKFARDCDKSTCTWSICAIQLSDRRQRFQQVSLHVEVLFVQSNKWSLSHAHRDNCARAWCGDYSRAGFILFSSSLMYGLWPGIP